MTALHYRILTISFTVYLQSALQFICDARSLQNSMKWDEDRFGLEYDLDMYNIVAVKARICNPVSGCPMLSALLEDFNMGAMENKSLNVFNTSLTLAREDTATDDDYERIEGVIGHEYFHNWTAPSCAMSCQRCFDMK